ncbi:MAG: hypothetical protein JW708_09600 [Vallitaleaceae bacterium]|nr:hypothetical protein [Vallitaleaceae bacterium]
MEYYTSLKSLEKRFDRSAKQSRFNGSSITEFELWEKSSREKLKKILGIDQLERCALLPKVLECVEVEQGLYREKILIQVEEEVWMPFYVLVPSARRKFTKAGKMPCILAPHGHMSAGKEAIVGNRENPFVAEKIDYYHYDYGLQMAREGYVVLCPDARGFGERREVYAQGDDGAKLLGSSCVHLARMVEPLGLTLAGLQTWDLMRLLDYIEERSEWDAEDIGCIGFSGGGLQTLFLCAMDERISYAVISGYLYGYKDSLLKLNGNCSCNYIPKLWQDFDMGDLAALFAPKPLRIQSCREDHLNGERGLENVFEQFNLVRKAYSLYNREERLEHQICEGGHSWHQEGIPEFIEKARGVK